MCVYDDHCEIHEKNHTILISDNDELKYIKIIGCDGKRTLVFDLDKKNEPFYIECDYV